ncbi:MAG: hypothetical protein ABFD92_00965 [Planctomycetaceae bacterium]|nr:hypothetical protein [Planctomycetaceae bacterium]
MKMLQSMNPPAALEPQSLIPPPSRRWRDGVWLIVAFLYLTGASWQWWPTKDSALYLNLARSLVRGEGYSINGTLNTTVTPGLPAMIAGLWRLFGEHIYAPTLAMTLCGLIALWLGYRLVRAIDSPAMALGVLAATALSFKFYRHSGLVLTEAPSAALVAAILAVWYLGRRWSLAWNVAALTLLSAAVVTVRVPLVALMVIIAAGVLLEVRAVPCRRRRLWSAGAILAGALAPTVIFYWLSRSLSQETPLYLKVLAEEPLAGPTLIGRLVGTVQGMTLGLPNVLAEMFSGQDGLVIALVLGYPLLALMIVGLVGQWRRGLRILPLAAIIFPLVSALSLGAWAVKVRYLIPLHLVMILLVLQGLLIAAARLKPFADRRKLAFVLIVAVACSVAANAPRMLKRWYRSAVAARTNSFFSTIDAGQYRDLPALAAMFRTAGDGPIAVAPDQALVLQYFADRPVEMMVPPVETVGDADRQAASILRSRCALAVLDREVPDAFARRLGELLTAPVDGDPQYQLVEGLKNHRVWRRRGP